MKQGLLHQMFRYGLVGGVVFASDMAAFTALLFAFPTAHLVANIIGKGAGAAVGFVLHKHFTFSWEQKDKAGRQALSYILVFLANIASSTLLLWLMVDLVGINAWLSKLVVDAVVIATSFLAGRLWVYRPA